MPALVPILVSVFLIAVSVMQSPPSAAQAPARYVAGVADLPLMPGLTERPEDGLVFDKPGGRIVEAFATGPLTWQEVRDFYESTLPQLGWKPDRGGGYLREGERLQLSATEAPGAVTVKFRLFPQ
ncbi:hypothetical protein [Pelagibius sp.]|uniref:hypothetical protein n=1 Tax=Pelagibius sp. TaxID=1931238 RepID=UPI003B50B38B